MTTKDIIRGWLAEGKRDAATHVIIVCDTYSHEDYPVYVGKNENVHEKANKYDGTNMQRIMEVYSLSIPTDPQVDSDSRVFNY